MPSSANFLYCTALKLLTCLSAPLRKYLVDCPTQLILFLYLSVVFHDKYERTQQGNLLKSTTPIIPAQKERHPVLLLASSSPLPQHLKLLQIILVCSYFSSFLFLDLIDTFVCAKKDFLVCSHYSCNYHKGKWHSHAWLGCESSEILSVLPYNRIWGT